MNSTGIHQMILQGPPGTSKTYGVKEFLALQAGLITTNGESWDENALNARQLCTEDNEYVLPTEGLPENNNVYWDIIQFHPSYTYEDFVRGISVSASDSNTTEITGDVFEGSTAKYSFRMKQPTPVIRRILKIVQSFILLLMKLTELTLQQYLVSLFMHLSIETVRWLLRMLLIKIPDYRFQAIFISSEP